MRAEDAKAAAVGSEQGTIDREAATLPMRGGAAGAGGDGATDPRYELGPLLASGGQGDVFRAYDRRLRRHLVMKVLDRKLALDTISIARFIQESQVTAQLEHPAIVPVHDSGALSDGRPYYTMTEVRGRTLSSVIADVHAASRDSWCVEPGGFGFGRLVDVFHRVCEAVGYAHSRRVIHRDLKPHNIMLGAFGEALVLDWGLARLVDDLGGEPAARPSTIREDNDALLSEVGLVVGTRGYASPEQAHGTAAVGPATDVYALGMILREILTGVRIRQLDPPPLAPSPKKPVPAELVAIVARAITADPAARYPDARELAAAIAEFIDGDRKRERARAMLGEARGLLPRITELRALAATAQHEARAVLAEIPPHAASALKEPGWALEDRARVLLEEAERATFEMTSLVDSSLVESDLAEAHALLADHYHARHATAEREQDPSAPRLEGLLRLHDRGAHARYLSGVGAITLHTDPPASIELRRYETVGRRLVDTHVQHLASPLVALELPRGRYLLVVRAPGCHEVRYPVLVERDAHWTRARLGEAATPLVLPPVGSLADDEVFVGGGPFVCGGDVQAAGEVLPLQRVWVDSFAIKRDPVTNRELLAMVNALVEAGDPASVATALSVVPRHRGATAEEAGPVVWPRDERGYFALGTDDEGVKWEPDAPAFMVSWHGAVAYGAWLAARSGRAYRLPGELEYEKAARGTDGRAFPWGDFFDPSWACMRTSHEAGLRPADVDAFPVDVSPYGARGLAGNVVEWCADHYLRQGPPITDAVYAAPVGLAPDDAVAERALRGGCFLFDAFLLRAASRHNTSSIVRDVTLGFRLARSMP